MQKQKHMSTKPKKLQMLIALFLVCTYFSDAASIQLQGKNGTSSGSAFQFQKKPSIPETVEGSTTPSDGKLKSSLIGQNNVSKPDDKLPSVSGGTTAPTFASLICPKLVIPAIATKKSTVKTKPLNLKTAKFTKCLFALTAG